MNIDMRKQLNEVGLLYLIDRSRGIHSRIRLQKLVCITQFIYKGKSPFSFPYKSYYYGPYSESLRRTTDNLVQKGFLKESLVSKGGELNENRYSYSYSIMPGGIKFLRKNLASTKEKLSPIRHVLRKFGNSSNEVIIKVAKEVSGMHSIT